MEDRINTCLNIINENIAFLNVNEKVKHDLKKEEYERYQKFYTRTINKTMEDVKVEIEKFHTNNDLYTKYQKFTDLVNESPEMEDTVCQFYDDVDMSFNAMTVEYKRKLLDCLKQNERNYDAAIDSLEKKVSANKSEISNYIKKVMEH